MATYTHEYQSTKKFYFDLDQAFVLRQAAPYIDESQDKVGIVVNVLMKLWLRVSSGANITRSNMQFVLFKYNSSLLPSSWTARGSKCYRYASDSASFTYDEEKFKPYLLATSETFTKTWKSEACFDVNFIPTDLGKDITNWNGRICLAVSKYGSGSGSSSTTTHCYWPWVSSKHGSYYTLQYAQESPLINLSSSNFKLGTTSTVTIAPYSTTYQHKVTWKLGNSSSTPTSFIPAGTTTASYTIPRSWRTNFGVAESTKSGKVIIDTYDASGNQIGSSKEYSVTYTIDDYNYNSSITITNDSIVRTTRTGRFTNSIFNNFLISGHDTFYVPFSVNFNSYNSKSKNISVKYNTITKSKNIEASSITSANTSSLLHTANKDSILMQVKVTDLRGKTGVLNCGYNTGSDGTYKDICNYTYLVYNKPQAGTISFYRGKEDGSRDDLGGLYGIVKFSNYKASYSSPSLTTITNTISLTLKDSRGNQVGVASTTIASGSSTQEITLLFKTSASSSTNSELSLDEEYIISGTITDLSNYSQDISGKISSSNYLLHFRYQNSEGSLIKQKSIGIGQAGRDLNSYKINNTSYKDSGLLSIAYPIELTRAENGLKCFTSFIKITDGGTGADNLTDAQANLKILPTTGGTMTGNLTINRSSSSGGIYIKDSTGATPGALYYNGTNLWIGSTEAATAHHRGGTYISAGYNGTTGNDSIYVSIPNSSNNGASSHKVYHAGNIFYSAANGDIPAEIPGGSAIAGMIWLKPIT